MLLPSLAERQIVVEPASLRCGDLVQRHDEDLVIGQFPQVPVRVFVGDFQGKLAGGVWQEERRGLWYVSQNRYAGFGPHGCKVEVGVIGDSRF